MKQQSRFIIGIRLVMPVIALIASFLPWMYLVSPAGRHAGTILATYNVYGLSFVAWVWLILDVGMIALAIQGFCTAGVPLWMQRASTVFAALSLGVSSAGPVFVMVASHVSDVLGAPNPVQLGYGIFVFGGAVLIWTATAFFLPRSNVLPVSPSRGSLANGSTR